MKVSKVEVKKDSVEVQYTEERDHGTEEVTFQADDPGHPDLQKAWGKLRPHVLSVMGFGDPEEDHEIRSARFKHREGILEVEFTILRKLPYTTRTLVLNTPGISSKGDGAGIPDRLHQLLNIVLEEATLFVKNGKRAQTELEVDGGEEEAEDG